MILCANPAEQFKKYQDEIEEAILRVVRNNQYIIGCEVEAIEQEFARFIGANFAVGVANGTDAIEIALRALEIGPGDEVITVSHTAVATIAAIESAGASAVLVDVEPDYYTLDVSQLTQVLSKKTKAVIAVHLYGQSANIEEITKFCKLHGLWLIEDVAQAHGARRNGKRLGALGDIGCFSCYPTKNLGAIGDGGLITTNDELLSEKIRSLREYGWKQRYVSNIPGRNSRLDEIQAAILRVKLRYLDLDNSRRQNIANIYKSEIITKCLELPIIRAGSSHVFHLFVIRTKYRNELNEYLKDCKIYPGIHYPVPVHLQPAYASRLRTAQSMRITEKLSHEVISLPMYPELKEYEIQKVIDCVNAFQNR